MKRVEKLISLIRERTRNVNFSQDADGTVLEGISDNLILQYLNEAQDHLQSAILSVFPNEFVTSVVMDIVQGQEAYTLTDRLFLNNKIITVETRQSTNNDGDYEILEQGLFRDRRTYPGYPEFYIRRSKTILLNPIPSSTQGDARITYYRELDDLDIRRASILSHTASPTALTALTLTAIDEDTSYLEDADYLCVNDRYGVVTMYNIPITSYDPDTGVVTLDSFTFASGETIANGDYITVGQYTTTTSTLPDNCERYLLMYAQTRILTTDESNASVEENTVLQKIEGDILNSFAEESRDIQQIPIIDYDLMN